MGKQIRILQVCSKLPPANCGVGDFANNLADAIGDRLCVESFATDQFKGLSNREKEVALLHELIGNNSESTILLLHFSGYSYARWGLCFWLVSALEKFLRANHSNKLVTVFHELWATGPVTSTAFWANGFQRRIARSLYSLSCHRRFSRMRSLEEFNQEFKRPLDYTDDTISVMPVFSSLGECKEVTPWHERKSELVLILPPAIGNPNANLFWDQWDKVSKLLGITVTHVIGRVSALPDDMRIVNHGFVTADFAHELLSNVRYSIFQYFPGYYAKSSIFAALAAHGIPVITVGDVSSEQDGLYPRVNYLPASDNCLSEQQLQTVSWNLFNWYKSHDKLSHADSIVRLANNLQGLSCGV